MASYNKVILMGNLTRDPQLSYLPSQTPVVEFGLATNRRWRSPDGTDREEVCFIDCRCYGKQAETISKYCKKGRPLMIEGRLTLDRWEGQDGAKHSKHRVTIERFTFVDSRGADSGEPTGASGDAANNDAAAPEPPGDDIPF